MRFARRPNVLGLLLGSLLVVLSLSGCLSEQRRDVSLEKTLRAYASAVRWGHLEDAYYFARLAPGEIPDLPEGLENLRVTGYEVLRPVAHPEENKATQVVEIQYLRRDEQVIRRVVDQQSWEYDPEEKRWYLTSPVARLR